MHTKQSGFTLMELMITVAIIAVVTSIGIPMYSGYIRSAHLSECFNEVSAIELAQNEFFLENNTYFEGDSITEIRDNSGGIYVHSFADDDAALASNCTYDVNPGATADITTSFQINAAGRVGGDLADIDCAASKPTPDCP